MTLGQSGSQLTASQIKYPCDAMRHVCAYETFQVQEIDKHMSSVYRQPQTNTVQIIPGKLRYEGKVSNVENHLNSD